MSTIYQVAEASGVSISTVSRVLNQRGNVDDDTRGAVLEAARKLKYKPKATARPDTVALVVGAPEHLQLNVYEAELLAALAGALTRRRCRYEILPFDSMKGLHPGLHKAFVSIMYNDPMHRVLKSLDDVPVITVNSRSAGCHLVSSDNCEAIRQIIDHLRQLGHTRIAFYQATDSTWGTRERARAYHERIEIEGLEPLYRVAPVRDALAAVAMLMKENPTALIVGGEDASLPAWHALQILGVRIPDDLSLAVWESREITRYLYPSPTAVSQELNAIAEVTVDLLQEVLSRPPPSALTRLVPPRLVLRDSVKRLQENAKMPAERLFSKPGSCQRPEAGAVTAE